MPIWHLDLYRIERASEIEDLDLELYTPPDGATLVEWASRAPGRWPTERIEIELSIEEHGRRACLRGFFRSAAIVQRISLAYEPA